MVAWVTHTTVIFGGVSYPLVMIVEHITQASPLRTLSRLPETAHFLFYDPMES